MYHLLTQLGHNNQSLAFSNYSIINYQIKVQRQPINIKYLIKKVNKKLII